MLFSTLTAAVLAATSVSAQYTYSLLSEERKSGRLTFIPLTKDQRNVVLTNAENILKAWVNRDSKALNYGEAANPDPIIKSLRANFDQLTDEQLQFGLVDIFNRIRDQHTRYFNLGPYRCFFANTGLTYAFVERTGAAGQDDAANLAQNPTVIVTSKTTDPALAKLLGAEFAKVELYDELVSVNGKTFRQWFDSVKFDGPQGANDFGGQRTALEYLGTVYASIGRLPAQDSIQLTFRSRKHYGKIYSVNIPYVVARTDTCWKVTSQLYQKVSGKTLPGTPAPSFRATAGLTDSDVTRLRKAQLVKDQKRPRARIDDSDKREAQKTLFPSTAAFPLKYTEGDVTKVLWGIWTKKNLGVIRIDDFEPADPSGSGDDVNVAIQYIRKLLANELKDTAAVVFDLRNNPGGYISFANYLPQLFRPQPFNPFGAHYLRNNVTYNIFVNGKDPSDPWAKVWSETPAGDRYTHIALFDTLLESNTVGQAYLRPMAVYTDGNCYSACDMFSANVQDSATGTVFGEDGNTGAGGANILDLDPNLISLDPADFKPFPYVKELTTPTGGIYSNRLSVGIRQSVRNGRNIGRLIEDLGIKSDFIIRPRVEDLVINATVSSQLDRIADKLAQIGAKNGKNNLHFVAEPYNIEVSSGDLKINAESAGITDFTIYDAAGKSLGAFKPSTTTKSKIVITSSPARSGLGNSQITIVGATNGQQTLLTKRNIRVVPSAADRQDITKGDFTFSAPGKSVGIYNSATTTDASGWNNAKDKWIIGNGVQYLVNTQSAIEAFFTAPAGTKVTITLDADYDTEPDYDFLYLNARNADGSLKPFLSSTATDGTGKVFPAVSGKGSVKQSFSYTTTGSTFSVIVQFTSDGGVNMSGVTLNKLTVSV
ncbi:hypothetical protein HK105_205620 [Polyrhizophydium stewartii]|uniref:Tail specific protease domain-containing protein n=1 Tax=Polyrhizophydium stewartii TaxID=2732419 RepID=A0ABR4N5W3_9FUNG